MKVTVVPFESVPVGGKFAHPEFTAITWVKTGEKTIEVYSGPVFFLSSESKVWKAPVGTSVVSYQES